MVAKVAPETGGQGVAGSDSVSPTGVDSDSLKNQPSEESGPGPVFLAIYGLNQGNTGAPLPSLNGCLKESHKFGVKTLLIDFFDDGGIGHVDS